MVNSTVGLYDAISRFHASICTRTPFLDVSGIPMRLIMYSSWLWMWGKHQGWSEERIYNIRRIIHELESPLYSIESLLHQSLNIGLYIQQNWIYIKLEELRVPGFTPQEDPYTIYLNLKNKLPIMAAALAHEAVHSMLLIMGYTGSFMESEHLYYFHENTAFRVSNSVLAVYGLPPDPVPSWEEFKLLIEIERLLRRLEGEL